MNNQYIESHYQKGFMPGMLGTFEHIAEMSQPFSYRPKNAFGEVHHSLIQSVLRYHCTFYAINCIVKILFSDFRLSIITNDFHTKYIAVEKGVLQRLFVFTFDL